MNAQLGINPLQTLKCWIHSLLPRKWGTRKMEDCLAPLLVTPSRGTMMSSCNSAGSVNGLKERNSKADPYSHTQEHALPADLGHDEWVSSHTRLWAHSGERQPLEDNDCRQETIFPIPNCTGHTLAPVMVWLQEFFPCTHRSLCFNKSGTFFLHLLLKGARKPVKQVGIFSSGSATPLVALEVPRAWQDLLFGARAEQSHRVNNLAHLMTVYCSHLQYTHIFNHLSTHFIKQSHSKKALDTEPQNRNSSLKFSCSNSLPNYSSCF